MSLASDERLQTLSRVVFGQAHRLVVMVGIARSDGVFSPGELAAELGYRAQSSIQDPLRDLEAAGLISRLPKVSGRVYFKRADSKAWAWAEELLLWATATSKHESSDTSLGN